MNFPIYKMAESKREVRVEERLKIKIGEAKNLPGRNHSNPGQRDVFCGLTLDQEEIFRTAIIERTLHPFFGEEFQCEIPRRFRYLSIYVYDRDKTDKVIGKVAIKREELCSYNNKDHWFPLKNVDCDSEVQGKCQIGVKRDNGLDGGDDKIIVSVIECSELSLKGGACDPFAVVTMVYSNGKEESKRTKVRKKTNSPKFDESLTFEVKQGQSADRHTNSLEISERDIEFAEVRVSLWHDSPGMGDNVFLGEVRIPVRGLAGNNFLSNSPAWYYLQPRANKSRTKSHSLQSTLNHGQLGSIRLKINYQIDHVFKSEFYEPLKHLLMKSPTTQPITSSAAFILGEIVASKLEAAQPLVRVMTHTQQIVAIIRELAKWEISKVTDANTIFRGNTLVSKMMDEVMQLAGSHYLQSTLKPVLDLILSEKKNCEIDPTRVKDINQININLTNLKEYVEMMVRSITSSPLMCPSLMCELFHVLKELAIERFPHNTEVRYSVISGFIFLRFFAPAILGPRLFDLTTSQIDLQTNRTLTLISKTIQSLGNCVSCRFRNPFSEQHKEEYMCRLMESFQTDTHIQAVRQFLELISAPSRPNSTASYSFTPVLLKEGKRVMVKRAQGRKRFGRKNFKQRYFRLTTQDLSYSKAKGKEPLCCIPLDEILAVERLHEDSFKMKNMFQIIQSERALYVQANNCVEEKEWIDILTRICQNNSNRLEKYHPSAYINGRWLCCLESLENSPGCEDVTRRERLEMPLDPDRELQRIHSLIIRNMGRLEELIRECQCRSVYPKDSSTGESIIIEDIPSYYSMLTKLRDAAFTLEQEHRTYQRMLARETRYGSKQAPIGDDNYLLLAARARSDRNFLGVSIDPISFPSFNKKHQGDTMRSVTKMIEDSPPAVPARSTKPPSPSNPSTMDNVYTILKYDDERQSQCKKTSILTAS